MAKTSGKTQAACALKQSDIESRWGREGGAAACMPCRRSRPTYNSMTGEELDYYFHWRSMARRGRFIKASPGMLHLFTSEIIDMGDGAESLGLLVAAIGAYRDLDADLLDMMADACMAYALMHGLPVPDPGRAHDPVFRSLLIWKRLESDPVGDFPVAIIAPLLSPSERASIDAGKPFDALFTECLRRIDAYEAASKGRRLADNAPPIRRTSVAVYEGFNYTGSRRRVPVESRMTSDNSMMEDFLKNTLKCLIKAAGVGSGLNVAVSPYYPRSYSEIVSGVVDDWRCRRWKPAPPESDFKLDGAMIDAAKTDLDAVTCLMSTEEDVVAPVEMEVEAIPSSGDPWRDLASALDDACRGYLSAMLESEGDRYPRESGIRGKAVEDRINAIAMDLVGDAVVEGGEIVEDYLEDIRRALRRTG